MEAACFSETSLNFCHTLRRQVPVIVPVTFARTPDLTRYPAVPHVLHTARPRFAPTKLRRSVCVKIVAFFIVGLPCCGLVEEACFVEVDQEKILQGVADGSVHLSRWKWIMLRHLYW
jgi:hypothetical protein